MAQGEKNPLLGARLTYYIFEGVLVGTAGGTAIHIFALSGGGGGYNEKKRTKKEKEGKKLKPLELSVLRGQLCDDFAGS